MLSGDKKRIRVGSEEEENYSIVTRITTKFQTEDTLINKYNRRWTGELMKEIKDGNEILKVMKKLRKK